MEISINIKIDNEELKELLGLHIKPSIQNMKSDISPYACFFNEDSVAWTKNPECNKMFLRQQQNYANEKLRQRGYLFLNEVYDMLGIPRTKAGQCIGWIYDEKNPIGDNYVDFGIYDRIHNQSFVNGYEDSVLLDFNVDGNILDRF
jgi:hypothetical protein